MCKYCEDKYPISHKETDESVQNIEISNDILHINLSKSHYDPNELDFDGDYGVFVTDYDITKKVRIKFCPMCGRKLSRKLTVNKSKQS